jgi:hypothetical protein
MPHGIHSGKARAARLTGVFPLSGMVPDLVMAGTSPDMTK